jgi:hypothetical protein
MLAWAEPFLDFGDIGVVIEGESNVRCWPSSGLVSLHVRGFRRHQVDGYLGACTMQPARTSETRLICRQPVISFIGIVLP